MNEQHQLLSSLFPLDPLGALASVCADPVANLPLSFGAASGEGGTEEHSTSENTTRPDTCSAVSTLSSGGTAVQHHKHQAGVNRQQQQQPAHHASPQQQCASSQSHQQHIGQYSSASAATAPQTSAQEAQCRDALAEQKVDACAYAVGRHGASHGSRKRGAVSEAAFDAGVKDIVKALCPLLEGIACKCTSMYD
jgi:hypothetical protein